MAYEAPSLTEFVTRFPSFDSVDDEVVEGALAEAGRKVDETWAEGDFKTAIMLYAAHVLTLDGQGKGREVKLLGFQSVEIGGALKLTREKSSAAAAGTLGSTSFGVRFTELRQANLGGPVVI